MPNPTAAVTFLSDWPEDRMVLRRIASGALAMLAGIVLAAPEALAQGRPASTPAVAPKAAFELRLPTGHRQPIRSVAFSPDERRLLTVSEDAEAKLWDAETGRLIRTYRLFDRRTEVRSIHFAGPERGAMVGRGSDPYVIFFDLATGLQQGPPVRILGGPRGQQIALDPGGRVLAARFETVDGSSRFSIVDAATGASIAPFDPGSLSVIAFAPGGGSFARATDSAELVLTDLTGSGRSVRVSTLSNAYNILVSGDGRRAIAMDERGRLVGVGLDGWQNDRLGDFAETRIVALSQDGGRVLLSRRANESGRELTESIVLDLASGQPLLRRTCDCAATLSADGRMLALSEAVEGSSNARLSLVPVDGGPASSAASVGFGTPVAFSASGRRLIVYESVYSEQGGGRLQSRSRIVDVADPTRQFMSDIFGADDGFTLLPNERRLVQIDRDGRRVSHWDLTTGRRLTAHVAAVDVAADAGGDLVARAEAGRIVLEGAGGAAGEIAVAGRVAAVKLGRKGGWLAVQRVEDAGRDESMLDLFEIRMPSRPADPIRAERRAAIRLGGTNAVTSASESRDGRMLALARSGASQDPVVLVDLPAGTHRILAVPHAGLVALTPDGGRLFHRPSAPTFSSQSYNDIFGTLYDTKTGQEIGKKLMAPRARSRDDGLMAANGGAMVGAIDLEGASWSAPITPILRRWDFKTQTHTDLASDFRSVRYAEAAGLAAIGGAGVSRDTIRLWTVADGRELPSITPDIGSAVLDFRISPDGRRLAALLAGRDAGVVLWDVERRRRIGSFRVGAATVESQISLSPAFDRLALLSADGTTRLYRLPDGRPLATMVGLAGDEWASITPAGFFAASADGARQLSIVRGLDVFGIEQAQGALYRPDLVQASLAGDPKGVVAAAARRLDLDRVSGSGAAPSLGFAPGADRSAIEGETVELELVLTDRGGGIGRIEWRVGGTVVGSDPGPAAARSGETRLRRRIALAPGENRVTAIAYNTAGLIASEAAAVTVTRKVAASAPKPRLHVLAIGIDRYEVGRFRLNFAVADATGLTRALSAAGRDVYSEVNVVTVLDGQATREGIEAAFKGLAAEVRPEDTFVFFLAGHGKTEDGEFHFLPVGFGAAGDASVTSGGIASRQWQAWFASVPALKSVLLFDACESGSMAVRGIERSTAMDRLIKATGRTIITAAAETEAANEGYRGHGIFTHAVLDGLAKADADGDGEILVTELSSYVFKTVQATSRAHFGRDQTPQMRIVGAPFAIGRPIAETADPAAASAVEAIPARPTHVLLRPIAALPGPGARSGAAAGAPLAAGMQVRVVESRDGWSLIARDGRRLGYVPADSLLALQ
ncbi:caspase family protein [Prosthecodimorpha staleyi]|uniref:Caspase family protein n=1 Tax=Prosthecodimorpha staleyi TaxID=2840188 RepID=A0A947D457_9HYPH|nr:caspase family protein [Prosthecodimorpha staleyi]MBT9290683.1 caspase family protein [Prosthecodimorpha staleyi]